MFKNIVNFEFFSGLSEHINSIQFNSIQFHFILFYHIYKRTCLRTFSILNYFRSQCLFPPWSWVTLFNLFFSIRWNSIFFCYISKKNMLKNFVNIDLFQVWVSYSLFDYTFSFQFVSCHFNTNQFNWIQFNSILFNHILKKNMFKNIVNLE